MARDLKVLAWITEGGWEACVDAVARLDASEVTLIHVATVDLPGPPGRRHEEVLARMADLAGEAAQALLDDAVEWRWVRGGWTDRGPATVWTRTRIAVVAGEEPTPRQRVMVVADSGNGASNVLDWARYLFINTELTVHFLREPVGEWVLLDARTELAEGGAGLATSVLSDRSGPVARGAQALLVARR